MCRHTLVHWIKRTTTYVSMHVHMEREISKLLENRPLNFEIQIFFVYAFQTTLPPRKVKFFFDARLHDAAGANSVRKFTHLAPESFAPLKDYH